MVQLYLAGIQMSRRQGEEEVEIDSEYDDDAMVKKMPLSNLNYR